MNYFIKDKTIILFFLLNLYLIFNTLISIEPSSGIFRNFGFVRFIFLFIAINYFFYIKKYDLSSFKIWTALFLIVVFDVYFERFYGTNILDLDLRNKISDVVLSVFLRMNLLLERILSGLLFIVAGYLFAIFQNKKRTLKIIPLLMLLIFLTSVLITGERLKTIKIFVGFLFICIFFGLF